MSACLRSEPGGGGGGAVGTAADETSKPQFCHLQRGMHTQLLGFLGLLNPVGRGGGGGESGAGGRWRWGGQALDAYSVTQ